METIFDRLARERDTVAAEDDKERFGSVPALEPGHTLVVAMEKHNDHNKRTRLPGQAYWLINAKVESASERGLVRVVGEKPFDYFRAPRRILAVEDAHDVPREYEPTPGALRILAGCNFDPGCAAFRLHTAINEHTKHASAFVRWGDENPHCSLRQLDGQEDLAQARDAFLQADVLHNHVAYMVVNNIGIRPRPDQLLVRHYHGSKRGGSWIDKNLDHFRGTKLFGARLPLVAEAESMGLEMEWSPIPVPVMRYRALRDNVRAQAGWTPLVGAATAARPMRIAHSPTEMAIKGTSVLRSVVARLQSRGIPVELDLIHGVTLRMALERKALCDVTFDSFWLGIQGSGLEAGAMEQPVIAGDAHAMGLYKSKLDIEPYIFADDEKELAWQIERLAMDAPSRERDAKRTASYVLAVHDYAAVAERYEQSLAKWLNRSDILTGAH